VRRPPEEHLEENRSLKLVAERNCTIVGGALAFLAGDAVQVDVIALTPEARGLGIGRKLMEAIESEAIRLGAQSIYLGGATAENRGFYWRLGFAGRGSLMHKGLPLSSRFMAERRRRAVAAGHSAAT
jgi:GNAT superfamily N-acetyltransferase